MCGIFAFLDVHADPAARRAQALQQARILRHRGPDWSGVWSNDRAILAHERLAIVDVLHGAQPLRSADSRKVLAVNGEIYNHRELRTGLACPYPFATDSDCEVILPLYEQHGVQFLDRLRGMFAFVLYDNGAADGKPRWLIARDAIGIIPLYVGRTADGTLVVASEMKALVGVCTTVKAFPPGHYQTQDDAAPVRWWHRDWFDVDAVDDRPLDLRHLHDALIDSVRAHLMSDVPYGVLLSGGLDSSLVSAIAATMAERRVEAEGRERAWWPRLHSFSIGLHGSPDLAAAQRVADQLGTAHHGFTFTVQEGLDALRDVIWHIETYDVTSIRASTPMYLMARRIRAMGVKMVLSGEGSDEIFGGYLYFHKAPDARAFHEELVRKLHNLHLYDCLRANKSMAAFGVEARVPFLDRDFIDTAMRVHARHKLCGRAGDGRMEKHILRQAFEGWLPAEILWRQKEQFSDGVGYGWIDALKAHAAAEVTDRQLAEAAERFPIGTPATKEAYLYRAMFESMFPLPSAAATVPGGPSVACSTPTAIAWDASFAANADPSGRAVAGVHRGS
ncbi:MAG: asparagine synthase B [Deltaproteobacteria bacterium]|nr:asparagine synthase B [Deltaproteobacteria bacterium]